MANGYFGKVLWVDLSSGSLTEEIIPEDVYRQYFGGYALGCKLIYENTPVKYDPLGPDAILGVFPGLLTGSVAPLTGRYMVCGKSPLTGTWGDANSGGYFGPEVKKCGYDGILFKGMATSPKYLAIIDGKKELLDASDLWGLDCVETEEKLAERYGKVQVASIGPAGEKLSLISGVVTDKGRIAARSGLGALMGSKKLKAIILKGNNKIALANKELLMEYAKKYNEGINAASAGSIYYWKAMGTSGLNAVMGRTGDAPIKNWGGHTDVDFPMEKLQKIDGPELNKYKVKGYGCFSCPVRCGGIVKVPELNLEESHLPEYETCAAFGHLVLNDDLHSLFIINDLCNRAGLDTISAGGTVAFAIECYENGLLTKEQADGLELNWGNATAIIELVKKMIKREGIGNLFADGSRRASEQLGPQSAPYAIQSLGQELGMHDSKHYPSMGMSYAFDPTPGRHTSPSVDIMTAGPLLKPNGLINGLSLPKRFKRAGEDRWQAQKICVGLKQAMNAMGICEFTNIFQQYPLLEYIEGVVGWKLSIEDFLTVGYRIQTLRQAFTLREGVEIATNTLPGRAIGNPPFEEGPHKGKIIDYIGEYKGYCELMGWNPENGHPKKETLQNLNLNFVLKDL